MAPWSLPLWASALPLEAQGAGLHSLKASSQLSWALALFSDTAWAQVDHQELVEKACGRQVHDSLSSSPSSLGEGLPCLTVIPGRPRTFLQAWRLLGPFPGGWSASRQWIWGLGTRAIPPVGGLRVSAKKEDFFSELGSHQHPLSPPPPARPTLHKSKCIICDAAAFALCLLPREENEVPGAQPDKNPPGMYYSQKLLKI